jgi:hypothetical protein
MLKWHACFLNVTRTLGSWNVCHCGGVREVKCQKEWRNSQRQKPNCLLTSQHYHKTIQGELWWCHRRLAGRQLSCLGPGVQEWTRTLKGTMEKETQIHTWYNFRVSETSGRGSSGRTFGEDHGLAIFGAPQSPNFAPSHTQRQRWVNTGSTACQSKLI